MTDDSRTTVDPGHGADPGRLQPDRWWLVAVAGLVVFLAQLDTFIVTTALPTIRTELGASAGVAQWFVLGYVLPMIALALPAGRWHDRVGKRAALTFAATGFAVASVAAGLAPSIGALLAARIGQGMFAALLIPLAPALATTAVREQARGRAMGIVATLGPLGALTGPAVGGLLVQTLGWPWIFFVNVPIVVVIIGIGRAQIPADGPLRIPRRDRGLEVATLGGAAAALLLGLSLAASDGLGWLVLALAAVPLVGAWRRLHTSQEVFHLIRTPGMAGLHLAVLGVYAAFLLLQFLAPFYLQQVLHTSPAVAGATLLALPAAQAALGPVGGILADRWGRWPAAATGVGVLTAGIALVVPLSQTWTPADLAWRLAVIAVGLALFIGPTQTMVMSHAPRHLLGTTGASINVARQLGIALGPALATLVWSSSGYTIGGIRAAVGLAAVLALLAAIGLIGSRPREQAS